MADDVPGTMVEALRARLRARPFEPFTVATADGRSVLVRTQDCVSMGPARRRIMIAGVGGHELVDAGEIVGLATAEDVPPLPTDFEDVVVAALREQTELLREIRDLLADATFPAGSPRWSGPGD